VQLNLLSCTRWVKEQAWWRNVSPQSDWDPCNVPWWLMGGFYLGVKLSIWRGSNWSCWTAIHHQHHCQPGECPSRSHYHHHQSSWLCAHKTLHSNQQSVGSMHALWCQSSSRNSSKHLETGKSETQLLYVLENCPMNAFIVHKSQKPFQDLQQDLQGSYSTSSMK
jgi:hypothetical protein